MISITKNDRQIKQLSALLKGKASRLKREVAIAVNATARKAESNIAKQIGKELATAQKNIKKTVKIVSKANVNSESVRPTATVRQMKTGKVPLRDFSARQSKRGVSYKISKTTGRKTVIGAFQGPKPGAIKSSWKGRVFKRSGKARLPIVQLFGPSPWGVFAKKKLKKAIVSDSKVELTLQLNRRIRFLKLKNSGAI